MQKKRCLIKENYFTAKKLIKRVKSKKKMQIDHDKGGTLHLRKKANVINVGYVKVEFFKHRSLTYFKSFSEHFHILSNFWLFS